MQSFAPKINLRNQCIQLVLLQECIILYCLIHDKDAGHRMPDDSPEFCLMTAPTVLQRRWLVDEHERGALVEGYCEGNFEIKYFSLQNNKLCFLVRLNFVSTGVKNGWCYTSASTTCLRGVFRDDLSFQWVPVFFIAGTASGVGVGQSSQSRAEMRVDGAAFVLPPTPTFHGQRQLETSLYFDKHMYQRRMFG